MTARCHQAVVNIICMECAHCCPAYLRTIHSIHHHPREHSRSSVINWFDIPAVNFGRAVNFYETVLGNTPIRENMLGAEMAIFPAKPGEATGAIMARAGVTPGTTGSTIYPLHSEESMRLAAR